MLRNYIIPLLLILIVNIQAKAQNQWDDTQSKTWPDQFKEVDITSSKDGAIQKAYFYTSNQQDPQPLIISFHTWSGNYQQKDPLVAQIMENDWNYIHPDFRGVNNTPQACGSELVIADIEDAITYAMENSNTDLNNIHVIGASGGGYATLLTYMQTDHPVRSFSAWVPISDLTQWYHQSLARGQKYATHISLATTGDSTGIDIEAAKKRSPLFMNTPVEKRKDSKLYIYAGVHDGYQGSVPITQSLEMYNKVVKDYQPAAATELIPGEVIRQLVADRKLPDFAGGRIGDRKIHYQKRFRDQLQITIFEGGHEMIVAEALRHVPGKTILAIGDSNGAMKGGWVDQLQSLRFKDQIINTSISGNTVGFVNNGKPELNTLDNIDRYLQENDPDKDRLDQVVIVLGTNDCKAVFADRQDKVVENYHALLAKIKSYYQADQMPEILVVSPPPYGDESRLTEKYKGAGERVKKLKMEFAKVASKAGVQFLDIQTPLAPVFDQVSPDGVHLIEAGQYIVAKMISERL